ncbi:hypothetical protein GCM10028806_34100 [Spirosoma terrae]|uniref:Phage tail lysozyme domain-containing protein n=1 Tax=Spirosoma terrae TaxID=1968276 RepID=A0A6L9LA87_9BACT|nr:phage tail tip lysozyme [Spirosoma terrae]NDU95723.1 hypothetical protein [Spirosoma terrae]
MDLSWLDELLAVPEEGADPQPSLLPPAAAEESSPVPDYADGAQEDADDEPLAADESEFTLLDQIRSYYNPQARRRYDPRPSLATPFSGYAGHVSSSTPAPSMSTSAPSTTAQQAYQYLQKKHGLAPHVAAGIVGNLMQESSLNTRAVGDGGKARGLAQWHPDRWAGVVNAARQAGVDPYDTNFQLDYILSEPGESARMLKRVGATKTPEEAAYAFAHSYERPARIEQARMNNARSLFQQGGQVELIPIL